MRISSEARLSTFRKEEERIAVLHCIPITRVLPLLALVLRDRSEIGCSIFIVGTLMVAQRSRCLHLPFFAFEEN